MSAPPAIIPGMPKIGTTTEIVRSFTYKLNPGNHGGPQFESRDFYCSQKAECALEDAERVSDILYDFCRAQVMKAVKDYLVDMQRQRSKPAVQERKGA